MWHAPKAPKAQAAHVRTGDLFSPSRQACAHHLPAAAAATQGPAPRPATLAAARFSLRGVADRVMRSDACAGRMSLYSAAEKPALGEVLNKAAKRALGGGAPPPALHASACAARSLQASEAARAGVPGMVAMVIQVFALMWMRTTINYQYRHGGTMFGTMRTLYRDGGIPRFYRGLLPALVQARLRPRRSRAQPNCAPVP